MRNKPQVYRESLVGETSLPKSTLVYYCLTCICECNGMQWTDSIAWCKLPGFKLLGVSPYANQGTENITLSS
jgi:hypothetical protein